MKEFDLDTFEKKILDKGFTGYFQTAAAYPGKLKESISEYLDACSNGREIPNTNGLFILSTYLQWSGDDKERIECNLWVKHENDTFDVQKMEIEKKDRYGQLLKKSELKNLSADSVPTLREAILEVSGSPKQNLSSRKKRGFRI
ncbi:hypothetical protein [Flavobacterium sp. CF136]|uniref:hypothetical protein n=1 Tax=Flavobacterium sp. (strain CF136) TaxID=1144313 RepID=UPI0002718582|nr:hypothetical protein [Flavobacterium sp. CF136]EJL62774.1 hypothetical protein PMI10_02731 [Flavobacterium sp. CF136]